MPIDLKNLKTTMPFPVAKLGRPEMETVAAKVKPKKVAVCVPHLEMMASPFVQSVVDLFIHGKHNYVPVWAGGSDSALARNQAIRTAPEGVDYYLFIDSDMGFFVSDADRLVDRGLDVVSGICFQKHYPYRPCVFNKNNVGSHVHLESWKHGELFEVDGVGGAFLCVAAPVIKTMKEKYQGVSANPWFEWGRAYSEDLVFCERAKECGYKIMVDTGIIIDHFTLAPRGRENFIEANTENNQETIHRLEVRV